MFLCARVLLLCPAATYLKGLIVFDIHSGAIDIIGRTAGNKFGVILRNCQEREIEIVSGRLRAFAPDPPIHILAARAVQAISAHDDRTHAEVLSLVDSLLVIGRRVRPADMSWLDTPARAHAAEPLDVPAT